MDGTPAEVRFGASKVWLRISMYTERRGNNWYLKLVSRVTADNCVTVAQLVDLSQVTEVKVAEARGGKETIELLRQRPMQLPPISVWVADGELRALWASRLQSAAEGQTEVTEPTPGKDDSNTEASLSQPATGQTEPEVGDEADDEQSPYETIDDYMETASSPSNTPPPVPKKRISAVELRLETLYDSVNNLILELKELERHAGEEHAETRSQASAINNGAAPEEEKDGLLIDLGDLDEGRADDESIPEYPAPPVPHYSEFYLEPSESRGAEEPQYAQIRKNHVRIVWS